MKRVLLLLSLGVALLPSAAAADQAVNGKPELKLVRAAPLTLRGIRFAPGESVRVAVVSPGRRSVRLRANQSGNFVASFPDVLVDRCNGYSALAFGTQGSRAALKSPNVYCPPRL